MPPKGVGFPDPLSGTLNTHYSLAKERFAATRTSYSSIGIRSEYSPSDFDEIERQREIALAWAKKLASTLKQSPSGSFPDLSRLELEPFPASVTHEFWRYRWEDFLAWVRMYEKIRVEVDKLQGIASRNFVEEVAVVLSPFAAAAAIGLSVFKALSFP
jgi:hypothetical protein